MSRLKDLEPEQIRRLAYLDGSLDTIYNALGQIYTDIANDCPTAANYLIDALGAIDSASMACIKMFDKQNEDE